MFAVFLFSALQKKMAQEQKTPLLPRGLIDTLSGSAGGVALVTTGYPFDTMKVVTRDVAFFLIFFSGSHANGYNWTFQRHDRLWQADD